MSCILPVSFRILKLFFQNQQKKVEFIEHVKSLKKDEHASLRYYVNKSWQKITRLLMVDDFHFFEFRNVSHINPTGKKILKFWKNISPSFKLPMGFETTKVSGVESFIRNFVVYLTEFFESECIEGQ